MARVLDTATEAPHPSRSSPYYIWSSLNELLVGEDVDSHPGRLLLKSDVGPSEITGKTWTRSLGPCLLCATVWSTPRCELLVFRAERLMPCPTTHHSAAGA